MNLRFIPYGILTGSLIKNLSRFGVFSSPHGFLLHFTKLNVWGLPIGQFQIGRFKHTYARRPATSAQTAAHASKDVSCEPALCCIRDMHYRVYLNIIVYLLSLSLRWLRLLRTHCNKTVRPQPASVRRSNAGVLLRSYVQTPVDQ